MRRRVTRAGQGRGTVVADPAACMLRQNRVRSPNALAISAALPRHIGAPGTATSVLRSVRTTLSSRTSRSHEHRDLTIIDTGDVRWLGVILAGGMRLDDSTCSWRGVSARERRDRLRSIQTR
jgi:hypothetical protein